MKLLNREDIWKVYSMREALADIAQAFVANYQEKTKSPLRTRINIDNRRTLLMMPCYSAEVEAASVKTIGLYPDNAANNLPTAPAMVLLMDGKTAEFRALLDGDTVTKIRTGASSGIAFQYLGIKNPQIGVLIGTGGQAYTQVLAMIAAAPSLQEIRIVNPEKQLAESFLETLVAMPQYQDSGFAGKLVLYTDSDEAALNADLIILVTSATAPVLGAKNLKPGVTISCVGSYQPHMQECGADIMNLADKIYCDDVEAALEESGDLIIPLEKGLIRKSDIIGSIGQVISGDLPARENDSEIIVYETVGIGAQDLWAANAITNRAVAVGVGSDW